MSNEKLQRELDVILNKTGEYSTAERFDALCTHLEEGKNKNVKRDDVGVGVFDEPIKGYLGVYSEHESDEEEGTWDEEMPPPHFIWKEGERPYNKEDLRKSLQFRDGRLRLADFARLVMATDNVERDWTITYSGEEEGKHTWRAERKKKTGHIDVMIRPVGTNVQVSIYIQHLFRREVRFEYVIGRGEVEKLVEGFGSDGGKFFKTLRMAPLSKERSNELWMRDLCNTWIDWRVLGEEYPFFKRGRNYFFKASFEDKTIQLLKD